MMKIFFARLELDLLNKNQDSFVEHLTRYPYSKARRFVSRVLQVIYYSNYDFDKEFISKVFDMFEILPLIKGFIKHNGIYRRMFDTKEKRDKYSIWFTLFLKALERKGCSLEQIFISYAPFMKTYGYFKEPFWTNFDDYFPHGISIDLETMLRLKLKFSKEVDEYLLFTSAKSILPNWKKSMPREYIIDQERKRQAVLKEKLF